MTKLHSSQAGELPDRDDGPAPHVATALMRTLGVGELDEASSGTRSGPSLAARPLLPGFLLPRNDETASRNPAPLPFPPPTQACGDSRQKSLFSAVVTASPLRYPGEARFPFARIIRAGRYIGVHIIHATPHTGTQRPLAGTRPTAKRWRRHPSGRSSPESNAGGERRRPKPRVVAWKTPSAKRPRKRRTG